MKIALKQYKKDFNYTYSIGVFATIELLTHRPKDVKKVYISSHGKKNTGVQKIQEICRKKQIPLEMTDGLIEKITNTENNYAIGVFNKFQSTLNTSENHVVLVAPSDMGNLGTIIRTLIGFDIKNLAIIKPGVDIFNPKVIRASQGAVFQINFQYFSTFEEYRKTFSRNYYPLMLDGKTDIQNAQFKKPYSLIFGNEGSGLPKSFLQLGDSLYISQSKSVDSLNLAIAVGIVLHTCYKKSL